MSVMPLRFTLEDAERAGDDWGFNCGPASVAAVLGLTPEEIRPWLGEFESKGYTNPTLMLKILQNLHAPIVKWSWLDVQLGQSEQTGPAPWPCYGLARVQWEGPWTAPGVPMRVRYRHTHWVGAALRGISDIGIFDVNCMSSGGWVSLRDWSRLVVPWILSECEPKASGKWHLTHTVEIKKEG